MNTREVVQKKKKKGKKSKKGTTSPGGAGSKEVSEELDLDGECHLALAGNLRLVRVMGSQDGLDCFEDGWSRRFGNGLWSFVAAQQYSCVSVYLLTFISDQASS